jgi:hypothetical protein
MASSFSTLSATDRCIAASPRHCFSVDSAVHDFGNVIDCSTRNFNGVKRLNALRVSGDCFDVTICNFPHVGGAPRLGRTIRFTTTEAWVNDWIAKAKTKV